MKTGFQISPRLLDPVLAGVVGLGLFLFRIGPGVLKPGAVNWLYGQSDSAMFQIGWEFFRSERWQFPLGRISDYLAPQGTSIALTDSIPLLAIPLKMIAFLLPGDFQYFGFWLLCCYVLQGVFGLLLAKQVLTLRWQQFAAALLLLLCPVFLIRDGHIALTAHWTLVAALWLYFRSPRDGAERQTWVQRMRPWLVVQALVCSIHFYLAVMVMGIAVAAVLRERLVERRYRLQDIWQDLGALVGVASLVWYLVGYLKFGDLTRYAGSLYGQSGFSLTGFWNPLDQSLFLPALPTTQNNLLEVFNYLGMGVIVILGFTAVLTFRRWSGWQSVIGHWPLIALSLAAGVFALGTDVAIGDRVVFSWTVPEFLVPLFNPFRACSRFSWLLIYPLTVAGLVTLEKVRSERWLGFVLPVCVLLQACDLAPLLDRKDHYASLKFNTRLIDPQWHDAMRHVDRLLSYPPRMKHTVVPDDFQDLALMALRHGVSTTAGYTARDFRSDVVAGVDQMRELLYSDPDPRAAYVIRSSYFAAKFPEMAEDFNCTDFDGFPVCFAKDCAFKPRVSYHVETGRLGEYVAGRLGQTVILVVKDEASLKLDPGFQRVLGSLGSRVHQLGYGDSYVGVIAHGSLVFEQMHNGQDIEVEGDIGMDLGPIRLSRQLVITSGGSTAGDLASLTIDGKEVLFNNRGFNVAVLDDQQNVLEIAVFDTHKDDVGYAYSLRPGGE